ncbi:MAG: type II toxin-antitoxin system HicB family antitoxin [Myxococcales bacterium]|nr:type II toxin-antitoxin system HicB family antitoxin [Myxococcales bacterium]USN50256.1 MAG: type II toxin-antitoxin system HicB family antitoxin [Myxococcales bacterium]
MRYHFKVHKENKGYWAECVELKGCITQADTKKELQQNAEEALNLYLDEPESSKEIFPEPKKFVRGKEVFDVPVNPKIAFAMALRQERIKNHMTQGQVAKKLGLKNPYSYQRLENSKTANPSLMTIASIKSIFPNLNFDLLIA